MRSLIDILTFQRMIAPILLQILFWAGVGGTIYGSYVLVQLGHWAWWIALICGLAGTRVLFEAAILAYRSFDRLGEILDELRRINRTEAL